MLNSIKSTIKKISGFNKIIAENNQIKAQLAEAILARSQVYSQLAKMTLERDQVQAELNNLSQNLNFVPPGHFYSPIPSLAEIRQDDAKIFGPIPKEIRALDLREAEQVKLLHQFVPYYTEIPFQAEQKSGLRYFFENPAYSYSDAIFLYCMIRDLRPQRIIEVGSGFSSCVTLDTNELFFSGAIETTFIEPYPELLMSLIKEEDKSKIKVLPSRLQDIDPAVFDSLKANDILFIDSTHVSKINSDVNAAFFEILPRLASGVYIHFHDVFFPFEYPKAWVYEGRAWNEVYLLRAFLEYNSAFEIILMNTFVEHFHKSFFLENMPLCMKNPGGSIWLRKK